MTAEHYEVELREMIYEADGTGGLRVTGSMWKPVKVFDQSRSRSCWKR
jgi:hypothetical protein